MSLTSSIRVANSNRLVLANIRGVRMTLVHAQAPPAERTTRLLDESGAHAMQACSAAARRDYTSDITYYAMHNTHTSY